MVLALEVDEILDGETAVSAAEIGLIFGGAQSADPLLKGDDDEEFGSEGFDDEVDDDGDDEDDEDFEDDADDDLEDFEDDEDDFDDDDDDDFEDDDDDDDLDDDE